MDAPLQHHEEPGPEPDYPPSEDVLSLGPEYLVESDEGSFTGDPGTTDVMEVVENGETFFAPTDPVVQPVTPTEDNPEGMDILGGFAGTALDTPREQTRDPERIRYNDDEIAENVITALRNDAYTTDLDVDVEVVDGIVYLRGRVNSIEDVEQAEEVAGSVEGVVDVEEELEIV
jgi:hypothetical protein